MLKLNVINDIIEDFEKKVKEKVFKLRDYLIKGNLKQFEEELHEEVTKLYNRLACIFIMEVAKLKELKEKAKIIGQKKGLKAIRQKTVKLQLKTGFKIEIFSWYAAKSSPKNRKKKKRGPNGLGCHLLLEYWGCILKATPSYYSLTTMLSILCPSFEIVLQVLRNQGIEGEYKRIRQIAYEVGQECFNKRKKIGLKAGENLKGKRVLIAIDGGRTRTRVKNPNKKPSKAYKGKREKFDTPWKEPKLFVIQVLEDDGSISKMELPIYDCLLDNANPCFDLLTEYLKELQIEKATEVLFIADGATWIWKRVKPMLLSLGVAEEKINEAVDFYHAVEHISEIINSLNKKRKKLSSKEKKALFKNLKSDLWNGKVNLVIQKISKLAKGRKKILNKLNYFKKNLHRLQYNILRQKNLPCGSGIIESAIRRIINLRFKSPSTFWESKNVEKLIFLRGIFLAKRWDIMIENISKKNYIPTSYCMAA